MGKLRVGTSSFTAVGWRGTFYPEGLNKSDFLGYYATQFDTLEIDSTWYGPPSERTVHHWNAQTPDGFIMSAKVPQVITHERCLERCDEEMNAFLKVMDPLGPKLGSLLFQFPYFNQNVFATAEPFLRRLEQFLPKLPGGFRYAVEVRNKAFLTEALHQLLRKHKVALVLVDHPWMPSPTAWFGANPITTDVSYIRLLGDRHDIEEKTSSWDRVIVDRTREILEWTEACEKAVRRGVDVFVYVNNHYSGHAPATAREFLKQWKARRTSAGSSAEEESKPTAAPLVRSVSRKSGNSTQVKLWPDM